MPQVPTLDGPQLSPQLDAPSRYSRVQAPADAFGASVGIATQALGGAFGQLAQAVRQADQARIQSQAEGGKIAMLENLGELHVGLETEPDPGKIMSRWKDGVTALSKQITEQYDDKRVAALIGRDLALSAARGHADVMRLSVSRTREASMAQLDASLATFATGAASAKTPEERARYMTAGEDAINQRVVAGVLHADKAEATRQAFTGRIDQAGILSMINQNPAGALAALSDPARFPNLDPVQRERLFGTATSALNTRVSLGERAERRAEHALKVTGDRAANDLYAQIARAEAGQGLMPTVADVAKLRDMLSPGETSALLRTMRGSGVERDDAGAVADLMPQVDRLDPDEFNSRATRAMMQGMLKPETYRTLVEKNRMARKDDAPASAYRSGRSFVSDSLDPGNVVGGQYMRGPLAAARSNALADFDTWAQANPTATREDAVARSRELVQRYQVGADAESKISLPRPYGFQGPRDKITDVDVQAAAQRMVALRQQGKLTSDELQRETSVLEAWAALLAREAITAKPLPPPSGGRGGGVNTGTAKK